jgi:hypothetical protein
MKRRKIMIISFGRIPPSELATITLQSLSDDGTHTSWMPKVLEYSSPEMESLMNRIWASDLPEGHHKPEVIIHGDNTKVVIESYMILPDFNEPEARSLAWRLEEFLKGEIEIIKNGY